MPAHSFSEEYLARHFEDDAPWLRASEVIGADPATYRVLNHAWSVDRNNVYLRGRPLRHVDRASFTVLNELYARDSARVFCTEGKIEPLIDPASFEALDEGWYEQWSQVHYIGYARDAKRVYFGERPRVVANADAASFEVLPHLYGRDRNHVFREGTLLANADPATFQLVADTYAKDRERVFFLDRTIEGADPETFRLLDEFLAIDARQVYDRGRAVIGADPLTFEPIAGTSLAADRQHVFVSGALQPKVDRSSFEHLGHDYYADRHGVYCGVERIEGADRGSFVVQGYGQARDRRHSYLQAERQNRAADAPPSSFKFRLQTLAYRLALPWAIVKSLLSPKREAPAAESETRSTELPRDADMRVLASVLANGDRQAAEPVMLAIENMSEFKRRYASESAYADEPDFREMLEQRDDPDDLHPFDVLETAYRFYDLFGAIDWRSDTDETIAQVEAMLRKLGVEAFDWSFIDTLWRHGDGSELRNNNFLTLLQDRLAGHELTLVHVNLLSDSYGFAIVPDAEYSKIAGFAVEDRFRISRDFGPDEAYDRGKAILQRHTA